MADGLRRVSAREARFASTRSSSSTPAARPGKPKGILHTTGGYLTHVATTTHAVFDLKDEDVYWCTADVGWITATRYVVYGPLANGATVVMYEGAPNASGARPLLGDRSRSSGSRSSTPRRRRSAPSCGWGDEYPNEARPLSLRLLGTRRRADQPRGVDVVPPGDRRQALPDRRHVVADGDRRDHDHAACPAAVPTRPGSATLPFPGIDAAVVDEDGKEPRPPSRAGYLVIRKPWPGMLRGIWANPRALRGNILEPAARAPTSPATAPAATSDGYFWIMGRIDDVINVVGPPPRHDGGRERARVARRRRRGRGRRPSRRDQGHGDRRVRHAASRHERAGGARKRAAQRTSQRRSARIAKPDDIRFTDALPKTRIAARSCGACCATSPPARRRSATPRRSRTTA